MTDSMTQVIAQGTMKAASLMVNTTNGFPRLAKMQSQDMDNYCSYVTGGLRQVLKTSLSEFTQEWKDAVDACMPESMLRAIVNAQCNKAALDTLTMLEEELDPIKGPIAYR